MASNPRLPDPLVVRLARENRAALLAREDLQVQRMAKQWLTIEQSLQRDMLILAQEIVDAKAAGKVITEQLLRRMDRYKTLNVSLKRQVLAYTKDKAAKDIAVEQLAYAQHGLDGAAAAIKSQFSLGVNFNLLSVDQVTDLSGLLGDGTPLNRLLKEAYPESLDGIVKALLEGSARGLGIKQIAEDMAKRMGMGLERITLIARTEQLRAWRISTQRQYQESGVVLYHQRLCARDARTCMSCLMLDGEIIPVDQVLDDHPRGRCTSIPIVKGAPPIVREMGQEWFERQSPELQKEMLGPGMYDLWKRDGFDLKAIAAKNYNPIWGSSPRVRTLQEMLGNKKEVVPSMSLSKFESVIANKAKEVAGVFDSEGNLLFQKEGSEFAVTNFTSSEMKKLQGTILTHNHPSGNTFSEKDIETLLQYRLKEMRAVGEKYAYSLAKGKTFKGLPEDVLFNYREIMDKKYIERYEASIKSDYSDFLHEVMQEFSKKNGLIYSRRSR